MTESLNWKKVMAECHTARERQIAELAYLAGKIDGGTMIGNIWLDAIKRIEV